MYGCELYLSPRNLCSGREIKKSTRILRKYVEGRMADVKITARKNGPYRVEAPEGSVELMDADGTKYDLTGKTAFALCRCGGSVSKPFCDGTHSRIGFHAAEAAVEKESEQASKPDTK